jgi:hypothetical protein
VDVLLEDSKSPQKRLKLHWFPKRKYFENFIFLSKTENLQNLSFPHFVSGMFFNKCGKLCGNCEKLKNNTLSPPFFDIFGGGKTKAVWKPCVEKWKTFFLSFFIFHVLHKNIICQYPFG